MSVIPTGACVKLQLESSDSLWDRRLEPDIVIKQKLTILSNGQIWLSSYMEGDPEESGHPVRKERFKISVDDAKEVMTLVDCYSSEITHEYVCDAGTWKLKLSDDAGEETIVYGDLFYDPDSITSKLSDMIRSKTNRKDLLLFDGHVED